MTNNVRQDSVPLIDRQQDTQKGKTTYQRKNRGQTDRQTRQEHTEWWQPKPISDRRNIDRHIHTYRQTDRQKQTDRQTGWPTSDWALVVLPVPFLRREVLLCLGSAPSPTKIDRCTVYTVIVLRFVHINSSKNYSKNL